MCPVCSLPVSWDPRGGNQTAERGRERERQRVEDVMRERERERIRHVRRERRKKSRTRKEKRQTDKNKEKTRRPERRMPRFGGSRRNLLMTLPLRRVSRLPADGTVCFPPPRMYTAYPTVYQPNSSILT